MSVVERPAAKNLELTNIAIIKINLLEVRGGKKRLCSNWLSETIVCSVFLALILVINLISAVSLLWGL